MKKLHLFIVSISLCSFYGITSDIKALPFCIIIVIKLANGF